MMPSPDIGSKVVATDPVNALPDLSAAIAIQAGIDDDFARYAVRAAN
jgi:hypothetical protein